MKYVRRWLIHSGALIWEKTLSIKAGYYLINPHTISIGHDTSPLIISSKTQIIALHPETGNILWGERSEEDNKILTFDKALVHDNYVHLFLRNEITGELHIHSRNIWNGKLISRCLSSIKVPINNNINFLTSFIKLNDNNNKIVPIITYFNNNKKLYISSAISWFNGDEQKCKSELINTKNNLSLLSKNTFNLPTFDTKRMKKNSQKKKKKYS
jgi:hypothetical protein